MNASSMNGGSLSCTVGVAGPVEATYILGPSGEQMTELDQSGNWKHTNVFAGGTLLATYDTAGLHFPLTDPLGTKRVQVSGTGNVELGCTSLPYGDGLSCSGSGQDATEHHFTGKERDTESGLDYFGARYYASSMGRWMSPDWADKPEAVPYSSLDNPQSLNLYGYVNNNPLSHADKDGHCVEAISCSIEFGAGGSFFGPVGTGVGVAIGAGVGLYIEYKAAQALGNYLHNQDAPAPAAAPEQGRDDQGKFLPKSGTEAAPGAAAEAGGLTSLGATKNNETINGTKRDGTITATGEHAEIKSGATISNTKQLATMGAAAVAATGKPLVVGATNPNVTITKPAQQNPDLNIKKIPQ